jgi:hypothetical protein
MSAVFLWVLLKADIDSPDKWKQIATADNEADCSILAKGMNESVSLHPTIPLLFICSDKKKSPGS